MQVSNLPEAVRVDIEEVGSDLYLVIQDDDGEVHSFYLAPETAYHTVNTLTIWELSRSLKDPTT